MRSNHGFTLIELMIVVVIIGILAAIAVPKFNEVAKSAKEAEAGPILKQLFTLQERYLQKEGQYATVIGDLEGGSGNFTTNYYQFKLTSDPTAGTYVACAAPLDPTMGLASFQINQDRQIIQGTC